VSRVRVYAARHGQSEYNLLGLCNDDPARAVRLTPQGRDQAEAAAAALRVARLDAAYTSPLPRARETADILCAGSGIAPAVDDRLADIRSGFDGLPVVDYQAAIAHDPMHASVNGGESLVAHRQRVVGFLQWLRQQPHETALLVAHEETMRVFRAFAEGLPDEAMIGLAFANCEVYAFEL
jgi:probable phosphoglycerate mutase